MMRHSPLDLSARFRAPFFVGYLVLQLGLLIYAQRTPDLVFGFQMFNASSELKITLQRKLRRKGRVRVVPVRDGAWEVRTRAGELRTYRWQDRVRDGVLGNLDRFVHASYGLDAQLFRLRYALRDVAAHLPDDDETLALIALVDTVKNGRAQPRVRFEAER